MRALEDKVALITGASAGIGRATALMFAEHGASLILNARDASRLEDVARLIRARDVSVQVVPGDAGEPQTHDAIVDIAQRCFGGLDIAINNAGTTGLISPLAELPITEWDHVLRVNLTGAFLGARSQIPLMLKRGGGSIVFISSFVGTSVGLPGMGAYGATKAALMGLVKGIVADYGARGIRPNALLPGGVDTAMAGDETQKMWAANLHAMKRIARPEEIASAALFLSSSMASFVTGSALFADGGNAAVK